MPVAVKLASVSSAGALPVFFSVMVWSCVVPRFTVPNLIVLDVNPRTEPMPVPLTEIVVEVTCAGPAGLWARVIDAVRAPIPDGRSCTWMVQVCPGATATPMHGVGVAVVSTTSAALAPVRVALPIRRSALPSFRIVSVWAGDVVHVVTLPKPRLVGATVRM